MMDPIRNWLLGDPVGRWWARVLYAASRAILGGAAGFFVVAAATPSRSGGAGFDLALYLGGIAAGAAVALAIAYVPRLLHPKDWPTREEFLKGGPPDKRDRAAD